MIVNSRYKDDYDIDVEQKELILKCILKLRNYNKRIFNEKDGLNRVTLTNDKSSINIPTEYVIATRTQFTEVFENKDIKSLGHIYYAYSPREWHKLKNCEGREFFRQVFYYNGNFAMISFIVGNYGNYGRRSTSMSFLVSYYDKFNNEYQNINLDLATLEYPYSEIHKVIYPDKTSIIPIVSGNDWIRSEEGFYLSMAPKYEDEIIEGLSKAYEKVEEFLGTQLEHREPKELFVDKIKRLIRIKKKSLPWNSSN